MELTEAALQPRRHGPDDPALPLVLALIRASFAPMEGRIDPLSSVRLLTLAALSDHAARAEVWSLGLPPLGCVLLTPKADSLYIGKLAIATAARGQGFARRLIDHAATRAAAHGLTRLELQTRIELTENHTTFRALGFIETGRTAHEGFSQPTAITFRKSL